MMKVNAPTTSPLQFGRQANSEEFDRVRDFVSAQPAYQDTFRDKPLVFAYDYRQPTTILGAIWQRATQWIENMVDQVSLFRYLQQKNVMSDKADNPSVDMFALIQTDPGKAKGAERWGKAIARNSYVTSSEVLPVDDTTYITRLRMERPFDSKAASGAPDLSGRD